MSNEPQKPFVPSIEHRWGLCRISQKKVWIGLTEREFALFFELIARKNPKDWMMWCAGWNEWKNLEACEKNWNCYLPDFPADFPQPQIVKRVKSHD